MVILGPKYNDTTVKRL